mmetsp:Transcript_3012/g.7509  ORF Transcript_3012/g.7509 Transcript_3012/m.7509 type:complete len:777 (+) Transcript_3012:120-2450(+)
MRGRGVPLAATAAGLGPLLLLASCSLSFVLFAVSDHDGCSSEHTTPADVAAAFVPGAVLPTDPRQLEQRQAEAAESFFRALDDNGDGQIESHEARSYVAGLTGEEFDTAEVHRAVEDMMGDLDGADKDLTVSLPEFIEHMEQMLQGSRVSDWIHHGLEMPQYAAPFKENAISIGDFPLLAGPAGSNVLHTDLKVESRLHRERIVRSIQHQMLGVGNAPSPPQEVDCEVTGCNIILNWKPPSNLGWPAFHKYVVEHRIMNVAGWTMVGETDADDTQFVGTALQAGKYEYRVTAWNRAGRSQYGVSGACLLPDLECTRNAAGVSVPLDDRLSETGSADTDTGSSKISIWMWINSGLSAAVYAVVILTKHTAQDPSFQGRWRPWIAELGLVRLVAKLSNRQQQLAEWAEPPQDRAPSSKFTHLESLTTHSNSRPDGVSPSDSVGVPRDASPDNLPYGLYEEPSADVIQGLTQGLYPKGFPVELVAPISPLRALQSKDRKSLGSRSASHMEDLSLNFHETHKEGFKLEPESRMKQPADSGMPRGQSSSHISEVFSASENGSGRSLSSETRYRCSHPGCTRSWDKWHSLKDLMRMAHSHYCGSCQRSFCGHHTRISPHGPTGSCGMDSACLCMQCYSRLPRDAQMAALARNKLPAKQTSKVASSQGTGTSCGGSDISVSQRTDMEQKVADLDSHLSQIRVEANWAKARSKISAVSKFLSNGRKSTEPAGSSRLGLPPTAPASSSAAGRSPPIKRGGQTKKTFNRDASPLKRTSLSALLRPN